MAYWLNADCSAPFLTDHVTLTLPKTIRRPETFFNLVFRLGCLLTTIYQFYNERWQVPATKKGTNLGLETFTVGNNRSFGSADCECADQSSNLSVWAVKDTSHSWTDGCRGTEASSDFGWNDSVPFCICLQNMWCWHFILTTAASASDTDLACSARSLYSPPRAASLQQWYRDARSVLGVCRAGAWLVR